MKYIRTKENKIYQINKDLFEEDIFHFVNKEGVATISIEENKLYLLGRIADTIEELCDEFVIREFQYGDYFPIKTKPHNSYSVFALLDPAKEHFKKLSKYRGKALQDLYGAIWTEWGLKYVAKMNDEGELELL